MSDELHALYRERAHLVAHLAVLYPAVMAYNDPNEPSWPVVYIDTPAGQCSWHINPLDLDLFTHVTVVPAADPQAQWDGHTTDEKYERLVELTANIAIGRRHVVAYRRAEEVAMCAWCEEPMPCEAIRRAEQRRQL